MLKRSRFVFASTMLLLLGILVVACGSPSSQQSNNPTNVNYKYVKPDHNGGTVIISDWQFPDTVNPLFATSVVDVQLQDGLWAAPIVISSDNQVLPDQLTRLPTQENGDVSKDGLTVTLHLRQDLKWSDGQPITSADFIYYIQVLLDPKTGAATTTGFTPDTLASYSAPDPNTVVLKYVKPFAPFLFYLPFALPKHAWGTIPNAQLQNTQNVSLTPNVTSGAFYVADYASQQSFTLKPNKHYVSTSLHASALDQVVFKGYQTKDTLIAGYEAGETDHAEDFTVGDLQKLTGASGLQLTPAILTEHLDFNLANPILADLNVRKAIAQAIDRCQIIQSLLHKPCNDLIANELAPDPASFSDPSIKAPSFDLAAAKADMQAAGWNCSSNPCTKGGQAFPTLKLVTTSGNQLRIDTIQLMKNNLGALGIPVNVDNTAYPNGALFAPYSSNGILARGQYDLALFGYSYPSDGDTALYYFHSSQIPTDQNPAGGNYQHSNDKTLDQLLDQGRTTVDQNKRNDIYKQVQRYVVEHLYELPMYKKPNITLTDSKVGNFFPNPTAQGNMWDLGDWYIKATAQ